MNRSPRQIWANEMCTLDANQPSSSLHLAAANGSSRGTDPGLAEEIRDKVQDRDILGDDPVVGHQRRNTRMRIDREIFGRQVLAVAAARLASARNGSPASSSAMCVTSEQAPGE